MKSHNFITSKWSEIHHNEPQGSVLGRLLFLLYINDIPKIINNASVPLLFANDTIRLVTVHKTDSLNTNMYNTFHIVNKWFKANLLSLNYENHNVFNVEQKILCKLISNIICDNNIISNISHTKFLGLIIDITLSWGTHIERIVNKLSCVCYIVTSVTPYMSHSSLIITLFSTPLCRMGLYFGETHLVVRNSITCKKEQFELKLEVAARTHVEIYLNS